MSKTHCRIILRGHKAVMKKAFHFYGSKDNPLTDSYYIVYQIPNRFYKFFPPEDKGKKWTKLYFNFLEEGKGSENPQKFRDFLKQEGK